MNQTTETMKIETLRAELKAAEEREQAKVREQLRAERRAREDALRAQEAAAMAEHERVRAELEEAFLTDADRERRSKDDAKIKHLKALQAHRNRNAQWVTTTGIQGSGTPFMTGHEIDQHLDLWLEKLLTEQKLERELWDRMVAGTIAMRAVARGKDPTRRERFARDIESADDVLVIVRGSGGYLDGGSFVLRSGDIIGAQRFAGALGEQVTARVAAYNAAVRRTGAVTDSGAWIVRQAPRIGIAAAAEQCGCSAVALAAEIKDAPLLAFAWSETAPADARAELEEILDKHGNKPELRSMDGTRNPDRIAADSALAAKWQAMLGKDTV